MDKDYIEFSHVEHCANDAWYGCRLWVKADGCLVSAVKGGLRESPEFFYFQ